MAENHFTISIDLPESVMQKLLNHCRQEGITVPEVGSKAIAAYLAKPKPETIDQMLTHVSIE